MKLLSILCAIILCATSFAGEIPGKDPRSEGFKRFYSPYNGKNPKETKIAAFYAYFDKKINPDAIANFEIMQIPEQEYPIMRITSRGDNKLVAGSDWPTFRSHAIPKDVRKLKVTFCVRINDTDTEKAQFMVVGKVAVGEQVYSGTVHIGKDFVKFYNSKTPTKGNFTEKFVTFDLVVDADTKESQLFYHGETTPICTAKLNVSNKAPYNGCVWWGDGSSFVYGTADLAYIGWTW